MSKGLKIPLVLPMEPRLRRRLISAAEICIAEMDVSQLGAAVTPESHMVGDVHIGGEVEKMQEFAAAKRTRAHLAANRKLKCKTAKLVREANGRNSQFNWAPFG
ncbi:MAG: hypothetical protein LBI39_03255 [Puniceicoccales bacterium]|jgi:hypothetical protein|nr:hypothetical protein [Puniceicoccales bacterium]